MSGEKKYHEICLVVVSKPVDLGTQLPLKCVRTTIANYVRVLKIER